MTTPSNLRELADRVEQGEDTLGLLIQVTEAVNCPSRDYSVPYLTSLDAIDALVERDLAENMFLVVGVPGNYSAEIWLERDCAEIWGIRAEAATECAAYLAAVLRAIAAKRELGNARGF